ncbi:MAG: ABC transporter ATP-binding protein [Rhodothermia bacterium]|nr:ABC transporter ATP-binding protein [Rhodothermia bacterium]
MHTGASILSTETLSVEIDGKTVLEDIGFSVPPGSFVGLIGPNGSGKTTLLRAAGGLIGYRGSIRFDECEVAEWNKPAFARKVAFVRPASSIAFDFRVLDLVLLARSVRKRWLQPYDATDRQAAAAALASVDLQGFDHRSIHSLSSGEQQRVFLAQALAQEPSLLLLDEPTSHLDIQHQFSFMDRVRSFVEDGGTAVSAIHDLSLACRYADYLIILKEGRVVDIGSPGNVLTRNLIEDVFRVQAEVTYIDGDVDNLRFFGSL